MGEVFTKQAKRNKKTGVIYAPGKSTSGYLVFKLCENYNGKVRGGMDRTWRYVADNLTLEQAKTLMEKRVGLKLYEAGEATT